MGTNKDGWITCTTPNYAIEGDCLPHSQAERIAEYHIKASTIQAVFPNDINNAYSGMTGIISNGMQMWVLESVEWVKAEIERVLGWDDINTPETE